MFSSACFRLRTQLLVTTIAILSALTATSLLVVRQSVRSEVRRQTADALAGSVRAFEKVEQQQKADLLRAAAMLSELPTLKALMTTEHAATIQDASTEFWKLSGSGVLVLADSFGRIMAVHGDEPGFDAASAGRLVAARERFEQAGWWLDNGELFRVVARPIVAGAGADKQVLGTIVVGARINTAVAQQIGRFSAAEIALTSGDVIVASTLAGGGRAELKDWLVAAAKAGSTQPEELALAGGRFEIAAIDLDTGPAAPLRCYMLLPLDSTYAFLSRLNRVIFVLGLAAALLGAGLVILISGAITRPLDRLVMAVRALGAGDPTCAIDAHGSMEVVALAQSFTSMRSQLSESQRRQLEAERLAALGRAAASISHDLRHHLAALVANAEFLHDAEELRLDRDEIYGEIQRAASQMTGLIDSLLEVSQGRTILTLAEADIADIVRRAADAVLALPAWRDYRIEIGADQPMRARVDARKLERAFFNLLLNACEAAPSGRVGVLLSCKDHVFECRFWDTGSGIPEAIRETLFEPFVSAGKNNGTGLGLAIASKVILEHDGEILVERTSASGTTILIRLPRNEVRSQAVTADLLA